MFSRNKINARSQKCLNIFYGGEKEKKKSMSVISQPKVCTGLCYSKGDISLSLSLFLSNTFTSTHYPGAAGCLFLQRNCCQILVTRQRRLVEKNRKMNILIKMPVPLKWYLSWYFSYGYLNPYIAE